ncbi:MAG: 3-phosphoshikimate 1-carboxyvinyltransferase [Phycisphaerales bacterium]|nr:3-phosphoshikimate 1-carboxyvinyltransferase [Phycisphaerales bacterium]
MLTLGRGTYVLDGVERMRERPIGQLVDQLRVLGAEIGYEMQEGYPPIRIRAEGSGGVGEWESGRGCQFSDATSSQYISAVLMAAAGMRGGVTVRLVGPVTSEPYVVMTLRMMEQFGVKSFAVGTRDFMHPARCTHPVQESPRHAEPCDTSQGYYVPPAIYKAYPNGYAIEPDASNASYFLAAAAIVPGSAITIEGLGKGSLQGDVMFAEVLEKMGAGLAWGERSVTVSGPVEGKLRAIDIDMNHVPDMVQTLAVVAMFAEGVTTIRNVWNLRVKETDRLAAMENELRKLGGKVETGRDWIAITPAVDGVLHGASIKTYDDHRMAMAFAVAGLRVGRVRIEDPKCVGKTYPFFFDDLRAAVTESHG